MAVIMPFSSSGLRIIVFMRLSRTRTITLIDFSSPFGSGQVNLQKEVTTVVEELLAEPVDA